MRVGRMVMGTLYVVAGVGHFVATRVYMGIMPDYLPAHRELVLLSGVAEVAGGLGVLVPATRRAAAWGIVALLVAVMPANVLDGAPFGALAWNSGVGALGAAAVAGGVDLVGVAVHAAGRRVG